MPCNQNQTSSICIGSTAIVDCIKVFFTGEQYTINLTLYDNTGLPIDLNIINSIQILLYDIREYLIARYTHPTDSDSNLNSYSNTFNSYTGEDKQPDFVLSDIWFDNLDINILQENVISTTNEEFIIDKGKLEFIITSEISNFLMIGNVFIDIRILYNDNKVEIIKCLIIGINKKNKF